MSVWQDRMPVPRHRRLIWREGEKKHEIEGKEGFSLRISFDGPESIIQDGIRAAGEFYHGTVYKEYLVEPDSHRGTSRRESLSLIACLSTWPLGKPPASTFDLAKQHAGSTFAC